MIRPRGNSHGDSSPFVVRGKLVKLKTNSPRLSPEEAENIILRTRFFLDGERRVERDPKAYDAINGKGLLEAEARDPPLVPGQWWKL